MVTHVGRCMCEGGAVDGRDGRGRVAARGGRLLVGTVLGGLEGMARGTMLRGLRLLQAVLEVLCWQRLLCR